MCNFLSEIGIIPTKRGNAIDLVSLSVSKQIKAILDTEGVIFFNNDITHKTKEGEE